MTAKEAIEIINPELSATEEGYEKAVNAGCEHSEDYEAWLVACRMAFEALKKQVPAEPVVIPHTNRIPSQQDVPHCPNCKENLEMYIGTEWCAGVVGYGFKYCPYCGQATGMDNAVHNAEEP